MIKGIGNKEMFFKRQEKIIAKNRIGTIKNIFKSLSCSLITSLCLVAQVNFAFAQTAGILSQAVTQFFDNNGNPLSLGLVYTYVAGTSTNKTTWKDPLETIPNTNPIALDIAGRAIIYGQGTYTETVKDYLGNLIWSGLTQPIGVTANQTLIGDGQPVGTVKPWAGVTVPAQYLFSFGQSISRSIYPDLLTAITISTSVNCTSSNNVISGIADTTQIPVGSAIEFSCVTGATVVSKTSSTVTLSTPALSTITTTAVFFPWGNGDGSTTFNLPDFRGNALVGRSNMGGVASSNLTSTYFGGNPAATGAVGGSQSTTLLTANLPATTYNLIGTSSGQSFTQWNGNGGTFASGGGTVFNPVRTSDLINTLLPTPAGTVGPLGSATAFSNVTPSVTINYIIKVTADINAATTNGVASIGGMTGVIVCGTNITCTGNTISANIGNVGVSGSIKVGNIANWLNSNTITDSGMAILPFQTNYILFASASGNDANDCLTVGTACTLKGACDFRNRGITNDAAITINIADGTYNSVDSFGGLCSIVGDGGTAGTTLVNLVGNCSTPTNVVLAIPAGNTGIFTKDLGEVEISCMEFTGTSGANTEIGIAGAQFSVDDIIKTVWGTFGNTSILISAALSSSMTLIGTASMTLNAAPSSGTVIAVSSGANFSTNAATIVIPSALVWGQQFIQGYGNYGLNLGSLSFTGSGVGGTTGKRATLIGPGWLITGGTGINTFFPGSIASTLVNGAQDDANDNGTTPYPSGGATCGPGSPSGSFTTVKGIVTVC